MPHSSGRSAARALLSATRLARVFREPVTGLWLGLNAHLVHHPVQGGALIILEGSSRISTLQSIESPRPAMAGSDRVSVTHASTDPAIDAFGPENPLFQ